MKITKRIVSSLMGIVLVLGSFMLSGCSGKDYSQEVLGTWYCWHWYYNVDNGADGFYDDDDYRVFKIEESGFTVESAGGDVLSSGTYDWTKNGIADVYFDDGTSSSVEVSFNDRGQLKLMITETKLIYVLEVD